jgi:hypothetical protein
MSNPFPKEALMTRHTYRNGLDQVPQHIPTPEGNWQEVLELLAEHGFEGMAQAMQTLFNEAMKRERVDRDSRFRRSTALPLGGQVARGRGAADG